MADEHSTPAGLTRRQTLALGGGLLCAPALLAQGASERITVLYRREQADAPARPDPSVQAALLALEAEFLKRGWQVMQADARTYQLLEQAPQMIVGFAPDAGFSLLFSLYRDVRPRPGSDIAMAEVRLQARVFVGRSILVAEQGQGRMAAAVSTETEAFAHRRALELAAGRAAADLADKVNQRLRALEPGRLQALLEQAGPPVVIASAQMPPKQSPGARGDQAGVSEAPQQTAPAASGAPGRRFALIVGMSDYASVRQRLGPGLQPSDLPGVAHDMSQLESALPRLGFESARLKRLGDASATSAAVRQQLMALAANTEESDLVLIAISAHGAPKEFGPSGFGMPVLADFSGPGDANALDFWQLQSLVGNLPARRVVLVVDTCHSGGVAKMMPSAVVSSRGISVRKGTVSPEPAVMTRAMPAAGVSRDFAVLAASRPEELSLEQQPAGGLFISHLLHGLLAAPGRQTLEQVFRDQVQQQVAQASKAICKQLGECQQQTPVFAYAGQGNLIQL